METDRSIDRRRFMQGLGASAAVAVGLGSTRGPVGDVEAIPPLVIGGAALAGSVALGWALREYEVIGADSPPEGLTAEALKQQATQAARTRISNNRQTFTDNINLVDGIGHTFYIDGKIAAIEALNEQQSQEDVQAAAQEVIDDYASTVLKNLLDGWNETVNEFEMNVSLIDGHSDLHFDDVYDLTMFDSHSDYDGYGGFIEVTPVAEDLPNGENYDVLELWIEWGIDGCSTCDGSTFYPIDPPSNYFPEGFGLRAYSDDDEVRIMDYYSWDDVYSKIMDVYNDVSDGIALWVENVYSSVQSGEIDVEELITPRERAAMMAEDESMAQAIADLAALNIPVDVGREATIYLPHVDATIRGTVGATGSTTIEAGESYDPDTIDGTVYLTYDASLGEGTWGAFETGVDGGTVTFTEEPWPGVVYRLETLAGETVDLTADDFTALDGAGDPVEDWEDPDRWETDISADVEDAITEIVEVQYFSESGDTDFQTIRLADPFEVTSITDVETGDEVQTLEYSQSELQDDTNYITQEEWDDLAAQNEELIQMYEDSQGGGGGFGFDDFDLGPIPGGGVVVGAIALGAYLLGR